MRKRKNTYRVLMVVDMGNGRETVQEHVIAEDSAMLAVIRGERSLANAGWKHVNGKSYAENILDAHDSVGDNPLLVRG